MQAGTFQISLPDEDATADFAGSIAPVLKPGDTILLEGLIGAGKSAFARAVIRQILGTHEDVPSPTFTLVQTYDSAVGEIWHCDLYRLTHPDEALELGLDQAFEEAICLIEWPSRLGKDAPKDALLLSFEAKKDEHTVMLHMTDVWRERLSHLNE